MTIGPQIAFVDDVERDIAPLQHALDELNTGTIFFDATPEKSHYPKEPVESVKLLFLDLEYSGKFDPVSSAQWVQSIIPPNTKYSLVIWSKDTDKTSPVLEILDELKLSPAHLERWQKTNYDLQNENFSPVIRQLISSITKLDQGEEDLIYGQVIGIDENSVFINCRISDEMPSFQTRKFDRVLLNNIEKFHVDSYVRIHINTKAGSRQIDFFEEKGNLQKLFDQPDFFEGIDGNAFFIEG
jgi:hypothetical protein